MAGGPAPRSVMLRLDDPVGQLRELSRVHELYADAHPFTRCIRCNVELHDARPEEVAARVLPEVRARHRRFFTCPRRETVIWLGSHVTDTCHKLGLPRPAE